MMAYIQAYYPGGDRTRIQVHYSDPATPNQIQCRIVTEDDDEWDDALYAIENPTPVPEKPAPTNDDMNAAQERDMRDLVNIERDRRIALGTTVTVFGHADPIPLQGGLTDQVRLIGLKDAAQARLFDNILTANTRFRDANNVDHYLTDPQVVEMWGKGALWVQQIIEAAFDIKDTPGGVPADYQDDSYWSTT